MAKKPWGGRFEGATDPRVEQFTESVSFDYRLASVDVRGSQAHARMLAKVGLITEEEAEQIARTSQGQLQSSLEMVKAINHIRDVARRNQDATTDLGRVTNEQSRNMEEMATSAKKMSNLSLDLERVAGRFKLGDAANGASTGTQHPITTQPPASSSTAAPPAA